MSFKTNLLSLENNQALVMAILNVTPDSFSDGGRFTDEYAIRKQLELMAEAGVDIVDIGGESTRPNATPVSLNEELDRVLPFVELVKKEFDLPVSVDTYKVPVMSESIRLGVDMINDVNALQSNGAKELIAKSGVLACLMHKQGSPQSMQNSPRYNDVILDVKQFLLEQIDLCIGKGVKKSQLLIDPGFGFGKTFSHNQELFRSLEIFSELGFPLLVGVSRKKMITHVVGSDSDSNRLIGSVVAAMLAVKKGSKVVRVHDFNETIIAMKMLKVFP